MKINVKNLEQIFTNTMPKYILEVGVMTDKSTRKVKLGITNAEILYINENGSPLQHIPARPVLDMTIRWANTSGILDKTINNALQLFISNNMTAVDNEMKKLTLKIQNYARQLIYSNDGRLAPNSPSVAKRKGGNHPLFDTGQLARSITCRVIKIEKGGETIL